MTTEKHDPWALLREARNWVGGWSGILPMASKDLDALRARIDAALAERQDSAQNAVEWRPSDQRMFLDGVSLRVVLHTDGLWVWSVYWPVSHRTEQGRVATEAEAKSAALAAARGMN